jgi:HD-like signal output (HDOD) protein
MSSLAQKISNDIFEAIEADNLVLPTMPEMALRVREIAEDSNSSVKQLGDVIGSDAALTVRLIKVSNSALYRGAMEIENLNMALMRLGLATTCTLATGLAMQQMFQATTDMVDKKLRQVWTESSEIAAMSATYCKHYTRLRPDQATLSGLVHAIGVLPILSYAEENPQLLKDSFTLDSIIKDTQASIGEKILTAWDFPKEIRQVPSQCMDFTRKADAVDYADLVTVSIIRTRAQQYADTDLSAVTAYGRIGMKPGEDSDNEDLSETMKAAMSMLQ